MSVKFFRKDLKNLKIKPYNTTDERKHEELGSFTRQKENYELISIVKHPKGTKFTSKE